MESRRTKPNFLANKGWSFPLASLLSPQIEDFDAFQYGGYASSDVKGEEKQAFRIVFNVAGLTEDVISIQFRDKWLVFKVDEELCKIGKCEFARCCDHRYKLPEEVKPEDLIAIWTEDDYLIVFQQKLGPHFEVVRTEEPNNLKEVAAENKTSNECDDSSAISVQQSKKESSNDIPELIQDSTSGKVFTQETFKDSKKDSLSENIPGEKEVKNARGKLTRHSSKDSGMSSKDSLSREESKDEEISLDSQKDEDSNSDSLKEKSTDDEVTTDSIKSNEKVSSPTEKVAEPTLLDKESSTTKQVKEQTLKWGKLMNENFKIHREVDADGVMKLLPIYLSWRLKPFYEPKKIHSLLNQLICQAERLRSMVTDNAFITPNTSILIHEKRQQALKVVEAKHKKDAAAQKRSKKSDGTTVEERNDLDPQEEPKSSTGKQEELESQDVSKQQETSEIDRQKNGETSAAEE